MKKLTSPLITIPDNFLEIIILEEIKFVKTIGDRNNIQELLELYIVRI